MTRRQSKFLLKQTLNAVLLNGVFSAIPTFLVFRHMAIVPLYGSPSVIADSILQTFIATLMSILPPSLMTARWRLKSPGPAGGGVPMVKILIRALLIALAACLVSFLLLPIAMPRLFAASLPLWNMLLLKSIYGMAIGLVVTPVAVAAVLREPRCGEGTSAVSMKQSETATDSTPNPSGYYED